MFIKNALAGIAIKDLDKAVGWYSKLLGRSPDSHPMPEVHEYEFPGGGWMQIFADQARAGKSSLTLTVDNVDDLIAMLKSKGIDSGTPARSDFVDTTIVIDPDGNRIVFAQAKSAANRAAA
jgi:catechol 2,3-dioxygenase-like lactoylglutathione lyase family enzyme